MEFVKVLLASIGIPLLMGAVGAGLGTYVGWQLRSVKARREEVARKKAEEDARRIAQLRSAQNNAGGLIKNFLEREFNFTFTKVDGKFGNAGPYCLAVWDTKNDQCIALVELDALAKMEIQVLILSVDGKRDETVYDHIDHPTVAKVCGHLAAHLKPLISPRR